MVDYDIVQSAVEYGFVTRINASPDGLQRWLVSSKDREAITLQRGDRKVQIQQRKPRGTDYPYRVVFVDGDGEQEEEQLAQADYLGEAIRAAKNFMRGFEAGEAYADGRGEGQ
jgi:hypothetical protein